MYIEHKIYADDIKRVANLPLPWEKLQEKSVLITGASGLIGTFLVDVLMHKNKIDNLKAKIFAVGRNESRAKERFADY